MIDALLIGCLVGYVLASWKLRQLSRRRAIAATPSTVIICPDTADAFLRACTLARADDTPYDWKNDEW